MTAVVLSNPGGLPLAVYGNPGRRGKKRMKHRRSRRHRRRNPVLEYALRSPGGSMTSGARDVPSRKSLDRMISSQYPGYEVVSVRKLGVKSKYGRKTRRKIHRKAKHSRKASHRRHRRHARKTTMAKTRRRSRRRSHRTKRFHRSRARRTVGHTYKSSKGWVRVTKSHVLRRRGRKLRHPAVKWSGRRGKIWYGGFGHKKGQKRGNHRTAFTNPRRRRARRNPGIAGAYVGGLTSAPMKVFNTIRTFNVKEAAYLAGGGVAAYVAAGALSTFAVKPLLDKVAPTLPPMVKNLIAAALPYTTAFVASRFLLKGKPRLQTAVLVGGAAASLLELLLPGRIGLFLHRIPGLDRLPTSLQGPVVTALAGPMNGLNGYVEAPAYSGVGAYVEAPSYSGVGQEQLAGYVEAPGYSGVGETVLAGFLDDKNEFMAESFLEA